MQQIHYFVPLLITAALALYLVLYAAQRRAAPGALAFMVLMLAGAEWSIGYVLELAAADLGTKVFLAKVEYLGIVMVPPAWFVFASQNTDRTRWFTHHPRNLSWLAVVPLLTLALVWTNEAHGLIWSRTGLQAAGPLLLLDVDYGPWFWVHSAYSYSLLLLGSIGFALMLRQSSRLYRLQAIVALLGVLAPWLGNLLFLSGLGPLPGLDLTPFAFLVAGLAYAWSLLRLHLLEIVPVARRAVVDGLGDGVIVLDLRNRIVDLNPAARRLVGLPDAGMIGRPVGQALGAYGELIERQRDQDVVHAEVAWGAADARRDYELHISPLTNRTGDCIGRLVVLHDITDRKRAEASLQQVKDELEVRVGERTAELSRANEQMRLELDKRQQAETAEREQRLLSDALRDTAEALNSTLDLDEVLDRILANASRVVPHDCSNIMLMQGDTQAIRVVRCVGYADRGLEAWIMALHLTLDTMSSLRTMAETGRPLVVPDTRIFPDWADRPEMLWLRSYAGVPIRSKGRTIGFLNFDSAQPGFFSPVHVERLTAFAHQAAVAIENARLFADAQQRATRVEVLNDIGHALASTMALDELYQMIYRQAGRVLDVDAFYVALYDEGRAQIHFPCNYDEGEYLPAETLPLGHGPTSHVIRTQSPFIVNQPGDPVQHGGTPFGRGAERSTRLSASALHVPMLVGDQVVGVISAQSYRENAYGPEDLQMLQVIAGQAAISIQNARLLEAEREQRVLAESLRHTAAILTGTLKLDEVLDRILENVKRVVPHDSVTIIFVEEAAQVARIVRRRGYAEHRSEAIVLSLRFPISNIPRLSYMAETGRPLAIPDTHADPTWVDFAETRWMRSYAGAPILLKERAIGFLSLTSTEPGFFTEAHAEHLMAFAGQAARAIENALLFEEISTSREALQALSRRLVEAHETESRHIARELHDEIGQTLTGVKLLLDTASDLPAQRLVTRLGQAQAIVNDLIGLVRNLSLELRPTMLDDLGLLPAFLWLFERYASRTGVNVNFDHSGLDRRFPPSIETAAYRIVQEALTNVARHARVDQVSVNVRAEDERLVVKVEDCGTGFDPHAVLGAGPSSGLASMRERATLLGGELIVESTPGTGTRLIARLPVDQPA